ncbi:deoxyribodipyrimidine photolyase-like protein [Nitritalea halalkaliphila LW7]|uniref:Deoxyribodipyrimidine photolyase-like protein n=1 Tax=Nitritalea halalkaliphila LW7 TaxID=1189621 RepID=I5C169_9BACT|nr:cryptochrome/photolyase family protein [Nitritalea halalkaliphila]EIM75571.1 deoxyribodipyrimidine photolyase-like protein [Nitritalea halalkaliphila LW7]
MAKHLKLILGDQLNSKHSWFKESDPDVCFVLMEMRQETDYVVHHIQKVLSIFIAMRAFASQLEEKGHQVQYLRLDDPKNTQSLSDNLDMLIAEHKASHFSYLLPDEYRLDTQLKEFCAERDLKMEAVDTEHFLSEREHLGRFFKGKKTYLMESFYRDMRKKYDILMEDGEPLTGKWNYDQQNRNKLKDTSLLLPPLDQSRDVAEMRQWLEEQGVKTIGTVPNDRLNWPCTRKEAIEVLRYFCEKLFAHFGTYQDAMHSEDRFLFHSRLSFALNVKLISPLEVVRQVEKYWMGHQEQVDIAQAEGFIRQILGWREYMRGVYWAKMPDYEQLNYFGHERALPKWFWTGDTKMHCLRHAITQSLEEAYAHHIQRLMVTGNFLLLAGVAPEEVDRWYLGIYVDAFQWVELTNTRGMSQFADGGIVGTKPYVSSANYIDKMSNYCGSCHYVKSKKTGDKACPFNSLYWDFYARNEDKLAKNPRIGMAYRTWEKMKDKKEIREQAAFYLKHLDEL